MLNVNLLKPLGVDPAAGILIALGFLAVVYGLYLAITYAGSKAMVRDYIEA